MHSAQINFPDIFQMYSESQKSQASRLPRAVLFKPFQVIETVKFFLKKNPASLIESQSCSDFFKKMAGSSELFFVALSPSQIPP